MWKSRSPKTKKVQLTIQSILRRARINPALHDRVQLCLLKHSPGRRARTHTTVHTGNDLVTALVESINVVLIIPIEGAPAGEFTAVGLSEIFLVATEQNELGGVWVGNLSGEKVGACEVLVNEVKDSWWTYPRETPSFP